MASVLYSETSPILLAIQAQLVAAKVLPEDRIMIIGDLDAPRYQASQILQLWPQDFQSDDPVTVGAGRSAVHIEEPLLVIIWTNLNTDESDRAKQSFVNPTEGHYPLRTKVMAALHDFWPTDSAGNALTVQPVKLTNGSRARKPRRSQGWAMSQVFFLMKYRQLLELPK